MGNSCSSMKRAIKRHLHLGNTGRSRYEEAELRRQLPGHFPSRLSKRFRWEERSPRWLVYSGRPSTTSSLLEQQLAENPKALPPPTCGLSSNETIVAPEEARLKPALGYEQRLDSLPAIPTRKKWLPRFARRQRQRYHLSPPSTRGSVTKPSAKKQHRLRKHRSEHLPVVFRNEPAATALLPVTNPTSNVKKAFLAV